MVDLALLGTVADYLRSSGKKFDAELVELAIAELAALRVGKVERQNMPLHFVDTGDGVEYYESEKEAFEAANEWIASYRCTAELDSEWPHEVELVCYGVVLGKSTEIVLGEDNEYVGYQIHPVLPIKPPESEEKSCNT